MKVLIIEDEAPAAKQLSRIIHQHNAEIVIIDVLDSVEGSVSWLKTFPSPDLIFMDIQLADGLSFDIFSQTTVDAPVIFTTAFDHYALKAFKVNSIDYLLKPVSPDEFAVAMNKYQQLQQQQKVIDPIALKQALGVQPSQSYKERFMVKTGQLLSHVSVGDIAYFISNDGLVLLTTNDGKKHAVDMTLDELGEKLDPADFFRINRKLLVQITAIKKIHPYFNNRLKLDLLPKADDDDTLVSRERVADFKQWLDK